MDHQQTHKYTLTTRHTRVPINEYTHTHTHTYTHTTRLTRVHINEYTHTHTHTHVQHNTHSFDICILLLLYTPGEFF